jgi:hypothetical protein
MMDAAWSRRRLDREANSPEAKMMDVIEGWGQIAASGMGEEKYYYKQCTREKEPADEKNGARNSVRRIGRRIARRRREEAVVSSGGGWEGGITPTGGWVVEERGGIRVVVGGR